MKNRNLKSVLDEVKGQFPFNEYISPGAYHECDTIISELKKLMPEFSSKRLLDIGSGPMNKTAIFKKIGFDCYAVDDLMDPWHQRDNNVEKIRDFASKIGIKFHHQKGEDYTIPFDQDSFDVVTILGVIEHLHESPRSILNAAGRFLKNGGLLVVQMPNAVNLRKRLSVMVGKTNYPSADMLFLSRGIWRGHVREYTLKETAYICRESGFEILTCRTFEYLAYEKLKFPLLQVYVGLTSIMPSLKSSLLLIGRKPATWVPTRWDERRFMKAVSRSLPKGIS